MTRLLRSATITLCVVTAACRHGMRAEDYAPAIGPQGAWIALRVTGEQQDRIGELLASDTSGVSMLSWTVVRISWSRIAAIDIDKLNSDFDLARGQRITPAKVSRLALVSRFPQGLTGELLDAVLRLKKQQTLEVVQ